jgi:hypothetical protein
MALTAALCFEPYVIPKVLTYGDPQNQGNNPLP